MQTVIRETADGSHTLFVPGLNEHYHSVFGAIQESRHVFIEAGLKFCAQNDIRIFEVGFGTGLNALLTAIEAFENNLNIIYHSIEQYPIDNNRLEKLNYPQIIDKTYSKHIFDEICSAQWDTEKQLNTNKHIQTNGTFRLLKIHDDLTRFTFDNNYNLVFFDAFAPDKQPQMWTEEIFSKLCNAITTGGILTTYSSKGIVKRALRKYGMKVVRIPGPPGKRDMLQAVKQPV